VLDSDSGGVEAAHNIGLLDAYDGSSNYIGDGVSGAFVAAGQIEFSPFPTSLMLNGPRADSICSQTLANMGLADLVNDFTIQIKYELIADAEFIMNVGSLRVAEFKTVSGSDGLEIFYISGSSSLVAKKRVDSIFGANIGASALGQLRGDLIDVVVICSSTTGLSVYVDGLLTNSAPAETDDFADGASITHLGTNFNGANSNFIIVKELNIYPYVNPPV
jgi:hypothetical protein